MKKNLLLLSLFIFNFHFSNSQSPLVKQWDARFGGLSGDLIRWFEQTSDGGFILGGSSNSGIGGDRTQPCWGSTDYWIVKVDASGNKQWDNRFGGTGQEALSTVRQTTDGGYILGGWTFSDSSGDITQHRWGTSNMNADYWVVKTDSVGKMQWEKRFGGTGDDELNRLQQTIDGGYILGGESNSDSSGDKTQNHWGGSYDYWVVKIDSLGNKQWDKQFGGTGVENLFSLQQTTDVGYILGGLTGSDVGGNKTQPRWAYSDYWIVKIDSAGNKQWDKDYGGYREDQLYCLQQTADGGYILGGVSSSQIGGDKTQNTIAGMWDWDYWIVKIDAVGIVQWDKDFGGADLEDMWDGPTISQTQDHGYLVSGCTYSQKSGDKSEVNLGNEQAWIVKTDSMGKKQWDKTILTPCHDETGLAIQTKDGCYVFANFQYDSCGYGGYKSQLSRGGFSDYWIVKFCDSTLSAAKPVSHFTSSDTAFCDEAGKCIDFFDHSTGSPTSWQWLFPGAATTSSNQQNPTGICYINPGTYSVTLITTNSQGTDTLNVSPLIVFGQGPAIPNVTVFGLDTLVSSHASSYQWYFNGSIIQGATDSFYVALTTGTYAVQVTDGLGCNRLSSGVLISSVSINESVDLLQIKIFPNPPTDELNISFGFPIKENIEMRVIDIIGNEIQRNILDRSKITYIVKTNELSNGVYVLQIHYVTQVINNRFVVLHK